VGIPQAGKVISKCLHMTEMFEVDVELKENKLINLVRETEKRYPSKTQLNTAYFHVKD
jgi:hypothetical protein